MVILYFEALAAIALSLSVLMAGAWMVQQRTGNSGWVGTIWTFSLGLVGASSALWPGGGGAPSVREWRVSSPRRMFVFLQNQGFGSIPLVFAIFVAARFPQNTLRAEDYLGVLIL